MLRPKQTVTRLAKRSNVITQLVARHRGREIDQRDDCDNRNLQVLMAAVIRPTSNCLDLGANVGHVTSSIVNLAPQGRHIAVEPIPTLAADLRRRFPRVTVPEVALLDSEGEATFQYAIDVPAISGLIADPSRGPHDHRSITVRVATLDSLVPEDFKIDFIKVDIEGAHVLALRGGHRSLSAKPVIWLDHGRNGAALYGTTTRDLWDLLVGEHGYRLLVVGQFEIGGSMLRRLGERATTVVARRSWLRGREPSRRMTSSASGTCRDHADRPNLRVAGCL